MTLNSDGLKTWCFWLVQQTLHCSGDSFDALCGGGKKDFEMHLQFNVHYTSTIVICMLFRGEKPAK